MWSVICEGVFLGILHCAFLAGVPSAQADTLIRVANHIPGLLDAPVLDVDGKTRVDASTYAAQLFTGFAADNLVPMGYQHYFGTGDNAGYLVEFAGTSEVLSGGNPGDTIVCQLRVWDSRFGFDYTSARASGSAHGESELFSLRLTDDSAGPLPLLGLKSFQLRAPQYGTIDFRNLVPGVLDAPVLDVDGLRLSGNRFAAQLYARLATNLMTSFVPIGSPTPFGELTQAGYWNPGTNSTLVLTNMEGGQVAELQVLVWEAAKGATYEQAARALGQRGQSPIFRLTTGNAGDPPSAPAVLDGLTSFRLGGPSPGQIYFSNLVPGELDAPVQMLGAGFVAQLYAGQNGGDLEPVGQPVPIDEKGYWSAPGNGVVTLPQVQAGDMASVEVRVWELAVASTYEQAVLKGRSGTSQVLSIRTGGAGTPPTAPAVLRGVQVWNVHPPHAFVVNFANLIPGMLDAPIIGPDGSLLAGSNYVAQLYGDLFELLPVGKPAPFGTGAQAGYWQAGTDSTRIIDIPAGCCADIQVRIWDRTKGDTFESAGSGPRAFSRRQTYFANVTSWNGTLENSGTTNLAPLRLDTVGVAWLTSEDLPTLIVGCHYSLWCGATIYDVERERPLTATNYVAQVYVAPDEPGALNPNTGQVNPAKFTAVGLIAPVRAGSWAVPPNTVMQLPSLHFNQSALAFLRVWDAIKGSTYEAAVANNSIVGESPPEHFITPSSADDGPSEIAFSDTYLRGHTKIMTAGPGLSLLGNPFALGATPWLTRILPTAPEGTMVFLFDAETQSYHVAAFNFGYWDWGLVIPFGSGFFIQNPGDQPLALTFEGVEGGVSALSPPSDKPRFYAVTSTTSSSVPLRSVVGIDLVEGDAAFRFIQGQWSVSQYLSTGQWSSFTPDLTPGEGLFLRLAPRPQPKN